VDVRDVWVLRGHHGNEPLSDDAFFFVYQPLVGDGSVLAFLMGQEGGNREWGKAGVTILEREAVRARAAHLFMPAGHGVTFALRRSETQPLVKEFGNSTFGPRRFPIWLRLQRQGEEFVPFSSTDGYGWTQLRAPVTLRRFSQDALAGLTVASAFGGPVTGSFANAIVTPGLLSPLVRPCMGSQKVLLTWAPVKGAVGYVVRRSAADAFGFTADILTPTPIRDTQFMDLGVPNDIPQRYMVAAVFSQAGTTQEGWATSVTVAPLGLPDGMMGCNLSSEMPQVQGNVTQDLASGSYEITGAGSGFGGVEDHGFFVSRSLEGDGHVTARVLDHATRPGGDGIAGLMIREGLDAGSRMAFLSSDPTNGLLLRFRESPGEPFAPGSIQVLSPTAYQPPIYLRLVRRGDTVAPYISDDGVRFNLAARPRAFTPPLARTLYFGYAIASGQAGTLASGTFSDLAAGP
jgi:hypothetical protein